MALNINDPSNVSRMSQLMSTANIRPGFNPQDIERRIATSMPYAPKKTELVDDFANDMEILTHGFNKKTNLYQNVSFEPTAPTVLSSASSSSTSSPYSSFLPQAPAPREEPFISRTINIDGGRSRETPQYYGPSMDNKYFDNMTTEEKRQKVINNTVNNMNTTSFNIEKEKEDD